MLKKVWLVKKAQAGNSEAFIELVKGYEIILYNMAYRFLGNESDVEDAIQETVLSAYENIKKLKKPAYFNTWLCRIMINHCQRILKNRNVSVEIADDMILFESDSSETMQINQLLKELDERYSTPLILFYYHGFSIKEISKMLDEPIGTIKSRLSRGREKLKIQMLKGEGNNE